MIIIGEKLNSSIPKVHAAMEAKDSEFIRTIAKSQEDAGADYLDVNAALFLDREPDLLLWTIEQVLTVCPQMKLMLDTPNPAAAKAVLSRIPLPGAILNSISLESSRLEEMLSLIVAYDLQAVCLPVADSGMPTTAKERLQNIAALVSKLEDAGIDQNRLYADLLVETLGADDTAGKKVIDALDLIRSAFPNLHTIGGFF